MQLLQKARSLDAEGRGRVWYIIQAALEYFISILVTDAFLARVTKALGFSDALTGILASFVSLGCVFQLAAITLFQNGSKRKRQIIAVNLINQVLFALVYLTPVVSLSAAAKTILFLVCFCGGYVLNNLILAQKTVWLMGLVPDGQRGSFTSLKEIVSLLGGMIFTYAMGSWIDKLEAANNMTGAFIIGAVTLFVLMGLHTLSLILIPDKPSAPKEQSAKTGNMLAFLKDKMLLKVLVLFVLWHAAAGCSTPFYGAYKINELGFSMTFVSVLSIAYAIVRSLVSPMLGRYADKTSFSRMVFLCFIVAGAGFLVNTFTVPGNGKVFFTIYYCLYAIAMGGINSSTINLVYDCIQGPNRPAALALTSALGGVSGFLSTCCMSPVVAKIQANGNRIFGMKVYAAQFASATAFVLTAILIVYVKTVMLRKKK